MLIVKTKIGLSKIHGTGLFADQFISKGAIIWKYTPGFDLKFSEDEMAEFPAEAQGFMEKYSYLSLDTGHHVLCSDDGRFYNHAETPNTGGIDLPDTDNEGGILRSVIFESAKRLPATMR